MAGMGGMGGMPNMETTGSPIKNVVEEPQEIPYQHIDKMKGSGNEYFKANEFDKASLSYLEVKL